MHIWRSFKEGYFPSNWLCSKLLDFFYTYFQLWRDREHFAFCHINELTEILYHASAFVEANWKVLVSAWHFFFKFDSSFGGEGRPYCFRPLRQGLFLISWIITIWSTSTTATPRVLCKKMTKIYFYWENLNFLLIKPYFYVQIMFTIINLDT